MSDFTIPLPITKQRIVDKFETLPIVNALNEPKKFSIDLASDIFRSVFGYRAPPFPAYLLNSLNRSIPNPAAILSAFGATMRQPSLYSESFCPISISKIVNGLRTTKYNLQYSTISVSCKKTFVETPLIGRRGTVKELIQIDDYEFVINGVILQDKQANTDAQAGQITEVNLTIDSSDSELPQYEIANLRDLFNLNEPVALESAFTEIFLETSNECVIKSIDFPDMKGISNAQAYTITLCSDSILELEML